MMGCIFNAYVAVNTIRKNTKGKERPWLPSPLYTNAHTPPYLSLFLPSRAYTCLAALTLIASAFSCSFSRSTTSRRWRISWCSSPAVNVGPYGGVQFVFVSVG